MKKLLPVTFLLLSVSLFAGPLIFEVRLSEGYREKANNLVVAFHKDKPSNEKCEKIMKDAINLCLKIDDSKDIFASAIYNDNVFIEKLFYDSSKKKLMTQKENIAGTFISAVKPEDGSHHTTNR